MSRSKIRVLLFDFRPSFKLHVVIHNALIFQLLFAFEDKMQCPFDKRLFICDYISTVNLFVIALTLLCFILSLDMKYVNFQK